MGNGEFQQNMFSMSAASQFFCAGIDEEWLALFQLEGKSGGFETQQRGQDKLKGGLS